MSNKQVCAFFFSEGENHQFSCKRCGSTRKQSPQTGFSNLLGHLVGKHPNYMEEYERAHQANTLSFVDDHTTNMYDWIRWVVERRLPLSEVENPLTRQMVKLKRTCATTLKSYMEHIAVQVGKKLTQELGSKFGLMFDGWSSGSRHYLGLFAIYMLKDERKQRLIGMSPMGDGQSAAAHLEYIVKILAVYDKNIANVLFMVGDNCPTNPAIANSANVPFIGCASHRFNLAIKAFMSDYQEEIDTIQALMICLRSANNSAELAKHTHLRPIKSNHTRWSSVFAMLSRYLKIRNEIRSVSAVEDYLPSGSAHRRIVQLHTKLEELDSVCVKLQGEGRTLADF
jgi:hypothetical protein